MKKMSKKILSIMLVALMVMSIVPMSIFEGHAATETDAEAISRARDSIVGGSVDIAFSKQSDTDKEAAVQAYVDNILSGISPTTGVTANVSFTGSSFGDSEAYTVAFSKGDEAGAISIYMRFNVLPETDAEQLARVKVLVVDGEVDLAYSKQTQNDKTAAVQAYVDNIVGKYGVLTDVTFTSGNTYSVELSKGSAKDTTSIDMTFNVLAETDAEAVARAKAAVVDGEVDVAYSKQTQVDKTKAVQDYVDDLLAAMSPTTEVSGTVVHKSEDTYTVTLSKGSDPDLTTDTKDIDMIITVLAETDVEAVDRARASIVGGTVNVYHSSQTQTDKTAAVQAYVDDLLAAMSPTTGVTGIASFISGNTYSVDLIKGSASDTKDINMVVIVLDETDTEAVARAKGLIVGGTVSVAYSNQTQADKTAAVQAYVDDILSKETPDTGVAGAVTHKLGSTYTVTLKKGSVNDSKAITMTVNVAAETDAEAVARAESLVKDGTVSVGYSNQTQADKTKAVEEYVKGLVADTGVGVVVVVYDSVNDLYEVIINKGASSEVKTIEMTIAVSYETLEGNNQVITQGTNTPLTFKTEGELDNFLNLYLNGKLVDKANYTTESGSVILTFTSEYIKSLPVGEHVFVAEFIDGSATINLEVGANSDVTGTEGDSKTDAPLTGDNSYITLFLGVMIISLGGIGTVVYRKKRAK